MKQTKSVNQQLEEHGIRPSAHRLAVAQYVLSTTDHPSADRVWKEVEPRLPLISRATVYNTLNLFVEKGMLRQLVLTDGSVLFDPNVDRHHHFIDLDTGEILDVPWDALQVRKVDNLKDLEVDEYQVVLRGRRSRRK